MIDKSCTNFIIITYIWKKKILLLFLKLSNKKSTLIFILIL